ncbi:MAG: NAD-dependent epimerase/dehydratase family protein, partial [Bosea sp. (in: a-proteobacteria)]
MQAKMAAKLHILITGASGFVGNALVRMALAEGHRVTALV